MRHAGAACILLKKSVPHFPLPDETRREQIGTMAPFCAMTLFTVLAGERYAKRKQSDLSRTIRI